MLSSRSEVYAKDLDPAEYLLGPDDIITVTVANHSELNETLTILPDGKVSSSMMGEINAAGKTCAMLVKIFQAEVDKTLNNAAITVQIKEMHSLRARVIGNVKGSGSYDLKSKWRVLDLIAAAGGLVGKAAYVSGRLVRGGAKVINLDVPGAMAKPDSDANIRLENGDLVLLDEMEPTKSIIHVIGQVTKPGAYELTAKDTLLTILSLAGNPTEHAALAQCYVLRGGKQIPMNLRTLLVEGKQDANVMGFKPENDDVIFIPENSMKVAVMGQVTKPGYFIIPETGKITVLDAINLAGGQNSEGDTSHAGIIRMRGGSPEVIPVNMDAILKKANMTSNMALQSEDILYIPAKTKRGFGWQDLLTPLSTLSFLGFRIFH